MFEDSFYYSVMYGISLDMPVLHTPSSLRRMCEKGKHKDYVPPPSIARRTSPPSSQLASCQLSTINISERVRLRSVSSDDGEEFFVELHNPDEEVEDETHAEDEENAEETAESTPEDVVKGRKYLYSINETEEDGDTAKTRAIDEEDSQNEKTEGNNSSAVVPVEVHADFKDTEENSDNEETPIPEEEETQYETAEEENLTDVVTGYSIKETAEGEADAAENPVPDGETTPEDDDAKDDLLDADHVGNPISFWRSPEESGITVPSTNPADSGDDKEKKKKKGRFGSMLRRIGGSFRALRRQRAQSAVAVHS